MNEAPTFEELNGMKQHETKQFDSGFLLVTILRVPYGWIYTHIDKQHNIGSSVFVPFKD